MLKFKIDTSKFHVLVHQPSGSYVSIEKVNNSVFEKLRIINDNRFEKISDKHLTEVRFLNYNPKHKTIEATGDETTTIKINELKELPYFARTTLKIQKLLRIN